MYILLTMCAVGSPSPMFAGAGMGGQGMGSMSGMGGMGDSSALSALSALKNAYGNGGVGGGMNDLAGMNGMAGGGMGLGGGSMAGGMLGNNAAMSRMMNMGNGMQGSGSVEENGEGKERWRSWRYGAGGKGRGEWGVGYRCRSRTWWAGDGPW